MLKVLMMIILLMFISCDNDSLTNEIDNHPEGWTELKESHAMQGGCPELGGMYKYHCKAEGCTVWRPRTFATECFEGYCIDHKDQENSYSLVELEVQKAMVTQHCPNKVPQYHCPTSGCTNGGKAPTTAGLTDCITDLYCSEHRSS